MITENPRKYGEPPYSAVLVHGGPGAPGEMSPVAKELSKGIGVLEPLQTKDSVDGQVIELKQQIIENAKTPVTLVGWSWGAWLSFILTSENPDLVKKLILVSSGPFEAKYAEKIMPTRLSHLNNNESQEVNSLLTSLKEGKASNSDFEEFGKLLSKADSFDPIRLKEEKIKVQLAVYEGVWKEAEALRKSGKLLEYGDKITCPVVVIHGSYDPHPFEGVKKPLLKVLKDVRFVLLENCGHHPWEEKKAKKQFYTLLRREL